MDTKATITIATRWYDDNAQHYSPRLKIRRPETNGLITGKEALRTWWQDSFERLPTLRYEPTRFIADDTTVFMEYTRHVDGENSMTVGEMLEIKDGLIAASRVYHS